MRRVGARKIQPQGGMSTTPASTTAGMDSLTLSDFCAAILNGTAAGGDSGNVTGLPGSLVFNASMCSALEGNGTTTSNGTEGVEVGSSTVHSLWVTIFLSLLVAVISLVTILGNLTVLLSFWIERAIRQPTNYFLASLAVSDLLIGTFSMPLFTQYLLLGSWPLGPWLCDLWLSLDWTVCLTSQYTVFLITMDRFLSVKIPAKYRNWRSERKVYVMIAITWVLPTVVFFTSIIGWQYFVGIRTVAAGTCEVQFMSDPLFTFLLTLGYYWITVTVMCVLYAGIYRVALNLQRKSDAKQKKLQSAIELAGDHSAMRNTGSNSSDSQQAGGKNKSSAPPSANQNGGQLRVANEINTTTTTSFSNNKKGNDKDDERSSSPAFASDEEEEENSSSQGHGASSKTPLTGEKGDRNPKHHRHHHHHPPPEGKSSKSSIKAPKGIVNSAHQPDNRRGSKKHISALEKAITGEGLGTSNLLRPIPIVIRPDPKDEGLSDVDTGCPDLDSTFSSTMSERFDRASIPLLPVDVIKGSRYIDDKSLVGFSTDNAKLFSGDSGVQADAGDLLGAEEEGDADDEKGSPVWKRRTPEITETQSRDDPMDLAYADEVHSIAPADEHLPAAARLETSRAELSTLEHQADNDSESHLAPDNHSGHRADRRRRKDTRLHTFVKSVRSRNSRRRNRRERKSKSENRARKALRTISIILGAFLLCWTPYHIMLFVIALCGNYTCINMGFYNFTYWLCYLNSPLNPFCYAFANAQFKRTFLRILHFDWHRT